jgi:hypothetical protein
VFFLGTGQALWLVETKTLEMPSLTGWAFCDTGLHARKCLMSQFVLKMKNCHERFAL